MNFQKLITEDKYQVLLLVCPAAFPVSFAKHAWFVCVKDGETSRYEVRHYKNGNNKTFLHINELPPFVGVEIFPLPLKNFLWEAKFLSSIAGDENSLAKSMIDFIENSLNSYPFTDEYFLLGPNSNTYIQWILDNFPEFDVELPWNCLGKSYK